MEAIKCMLTRKSIRDYSSKKVSEKQLKKILECAMQAPSAVNEQPWEFIIITEKEKLKELSTKTPYAKMTKNASAAIIVCINEKKENIWAKTFYGKGFPIQDCSAATENILLASHAQGLGAVWVGVYPNTKMVGKIQEQFNTPENIIPLCIIPIGYPKQKSTPKKRYDEKKIHKNKW